MEFQSNTLHSFLGNLKTYKDNRNKLDHLFFQEGQMIPSEFMRYKNTDEEQY